jgi:hypothetical protein
MTTKAEFAKNFPGGVTPPELEKLLDFQESGPGFEGYAEGFGLYYDDKGLFKTWSTEPLFLDALIPFAQATGGGSVYALWSGGKAKHPSGMPVVIFGDEGGTHVVADDLKRFLQLLTFGPEPMVEHDCVTYYKAKDFEPREGLAAYVAWLKEEWDLAPIDDAKTLVKAAQDKHQAAYVAWFKQFVAD